MCSSDSEHPLTVQNLLTQPLRTGLASLVAINDCLEQRIATRDDIADDPEIGPESELVLAVSLDEVDSQRRKLLAHRRIDIGVAAGYAVTGLSRDCGDSSHEGAANAENVDVQAGGAPRKAGDCTRDPAL